MTVNTTEKWHVDLKNLTCRNIENQMVVSFEKRGTALTGKIRNIPLELAEKWAHPNGNNLLRKAVIEADEVFYKAYFKKQIEAKCIRA